MGREPITEVGDVQIEDDGFTADEDVYVTVGGVEWGLMDLSEWEELADRYSFPSDLRDAVDEARAWYDYGREHPSEHGGPYIEGSSVNDSGYGFKIPLSAMDDSTLRVDVECGNTGTNDIAATWDTSVDVSDLNNHGALGVERELAGETHDGYAAIDSLEIVEC